MAGARPDPDRRWPWQCDPVQHGRRPVRLALGERIDPHRRGNQGARVRADAFPWPARFRRVHGSSRRKGAPAGPASSLPPVSRTANVRSLWSSAQRPTAPATRKQWQSQLSSDAPLPSPTPGGRPAPGPRRGSTTDSAPSSARGGRLAHRLLQALRSSAVFEPCRGRLKLGGGAAPVHISAELIRRRLRAS